MAHAVVLLCRRKGCRWGVSRPFVRSGKTRRCVRFATLNASSCRGTGGLERVAPTLRRLRCAPSTRQALPGGRPSDHNNNTPRGLPPLPNTEHGPAAAQGSGAVRDCNLGPAGGRCPEAMPPQLHRPSSPHETCVRRPVLCAPHPPPAPKGHVVDGPVGLSIGAGGGGSIEPPG